MADGKIEIDTEIETKKVETGLDKLKTKLTKLGDNKTIKSIANIGLALNAVQSAFAAVTGVIKGVASAINGMTEAWSTQYKAEKSLETAARNNPYLNREAVENLKAFASEVQSVSTVGDEVLMPMMAELAASGRTQEQIQAIITAAVDAESSGLISLEGAVQSLNRSYEGEVGQLARVLPQLKNLTKEELQNGAATKEVAKAFHGLASDIASEVGAGSQLVNAWGDFKEIIGKGFNTILNPFKKALTGILTGVNSALGFITTKAKVTSEELKNVFQQAITGEAGKNNYVENNLASLKELMEARKEEYEKAKSETDKQIKAAGERYDKAVQARIKKVAEVREEYSDVADYIRDNGDVTDKFFGHIDDATFKRIEQAKEALKAVREEEKTALANESSYVRYQGTFEYGEYKKAQEQYEAEVKRVQELEEKAQKETYEEYTKALNVKKEELKKRKEAGEQLNEEQEKQELLNEGQSKYLEFLKEGRDVNSKIVEDLKAQNEEITRIKNNQTAADAKQQYADTVSSFENEIKYRRSVGEEITKESELTDELNTKLSAYIQMRLSAGNTITDNNDGVKKILADIENTRAQLEAEQGKEKTKSLLEKWIMGDETDADKIKAQIKDLDEEFNALMGENEEEDAANSLNLTEEQKFAIRQKWEEKSAELYEQLTELEKSENDKQLENILATFDKVNEYVSNFSDTLSTISELVTQNAENEAEVRTASIEKQYAAGTLSEEEYYDAKEKIEKDAAKKEYKMQMATWALQVAQATANIAQGVTKAIADGGTMGLVTGALVSAVGAAQLATIIANKPIPAYANGGIVGATMGGDNSIATIRNGEMVLNARQQKQLWQTANGAGVAGGVNVQVKNYMGDSAQVSTALNGNNLIMTVRRIVQNDLSKGVYSDALTSAQNLQNGVSYTS